MRYFFCIILGLLILNALLLSQETDAQDMERIQNLEKIVQKQRALLRELSHQVSIQEQRTQEYTEQITREYLNLTQAEEIVGVSAGYENKGFFVRSSDGNMELYFSGFAQMGLAVFENDSYEHNSFYPNGINIAFDIYFHKVWHTRVELNFLEMTHGTLYRGLYGSSKFYDAPLTTVSLADAYVEYTGIPEIGVRVGQFHVPFTMQGQYNQTQGIGIWSDPFIQAWSHGRDPGIMIMGTLNDTFEYKASIHNGEGARFNSSDEMLMALSTRIYPCSKSKNANFFFHTGFLLAREDNVRKTRDIASASLDTPWGRQVFDGVTSFGDDYIEGWRMGVDVAARIDMPLDAKNVNQIRAETEFMYMLWDRDFQSGHMDDLRGFGVSLGVLFKHNLTPEVEEAGIFGLFKLSYSDIDNNDTSKTSVLLVDGASVESNIIGQKMYSYTMGLGYSFNQFISCQLNWVIVNLDEKDIYGGPKKRYDVSGSLEQAWFFQVTARW